MFLNLKRFAVRRLIPTLVPFKNRESGPLSLDKYEADLVQSGGDSPHPNMSRRLNKAIICGHIKKQSEMIKTKHSTDFSIIHLKVGFGGGTRTCTYMYIIHSDRDTDTC